MRPHWYLRDGTPASMEEIEPRLRDIGYKRVAEDTLPSGTWISTVWLGIDHSFFNGPPLIFETMVFPSRDKLSNLDVERYATEEEAIAGHKAMVEKWRAKENK